MDNKSLYIDNLSKQHVGCLVECVITGYKIETGTIQYEKNHDAYFICQNIIEGSSCKNKLGFSFSWHVGNGSEHDIQYNGVKKLRLKSEWNEEGNA
jgi:hypothetical protein